MIKKGPSDRLNATKTGNAQVARNQTDVQKGLQVEQLLQQILEQLKKLNTHVLTTTRIKTSSIDKPAARVVPVPTLVRPRHVATAIRAAPLKPITKTVAKAAPSRAGAKANTAKPKYNFEHWFINDFCVEYKGHTVTCRAVSEYALTALNGVQVTEAMLKEVAPAYRAVYKLVKTDDYSDYARVGDEILIQPSTNPHRKRLSAVRIY